MSCRYNTAAKPISTPYQATLCRCIAQACFGHRAKSSACVATLIGRQKPARMCGHVHQGTQPRSIISTACSGSPDMKRKMSHAGCDQSPICRPVSANR